jgi:hypothetical protein
MGVGATDKSDIRADFSNYGSPTHVKVFAPGTSILSTVPGGNYESFGWDGTSMSSPLVAGLAGLVRSQHKDWNAAQIMFQITGTADNLDALNPKYAGKMGYGRINALRALTNSVSAPGPDLDLLSVTVDDHSGGNGDGIPDPGETVKLYVTIQNSWGDAHGVQATIAFDPSVQWGVNVTHAVSSFGDVSGLMVPDSSIRTNTSDPINIALSGDLFPTVLPYTLTITANGGFFRQWKGSLSLSSRILLVDDDDGSNNIEAYYTSLLNRANLMYDYWDHHIQGTPPADFLKKYSTVIWACEWAFPSLDSTDRSNLALFLDQGGKLFISGQDIGWDLADPQDAAPSEYNSSHGASNIFYEKYLHAKYVADDGISPNIVGVAGDPIGDSLSFVRYQPGRASSEQFGDVADTINGSKAVFKVSGGTFFDGRTTAVRYDGVHKVVYFAFGGLESVTDSLIRKEVLRRTMKWLGGYEISVDALTDRETAVAPIVVTAAVTANPLTSVSLYWSPNSIRPFQRIIMALGAGGRYEATIPVQPIGTSIEYFVLAKAGSDYLPYDVHQFSIAPDRVPPAIAVADSIRNTMQWLGSYGCRAIITDQNGIDTANVFLHYRISTGTEQQTPMHRTANPNEYEGSIVSTDRLSSGDVIAYYISAIDNSLQKNTGRYPVGRALSFIIGTELVDDFEMPIDTIQRWNPGGWKRTSEYQYSGSYSITDSPDGDYAPNSDNVLAIKRTYDLSVQSKAVVRFAVKYEIDLSDTLYFEASNDAVHWNVLSGFNGTTFPFASLRKINADLGRFCGSGNEHVAIRFRLHADGALESDGAYIDDVEMQTGSLIVSVNKPENILPRETKLERNYPNPFNPSTTISFSLKEGAWTVLTIFDAMGREVETLCNSYQPAGKYAMTWNASGRASGVYFCRLVAGSYVATGRLLFLK